MFKPPRFWNKTAAAKAVAAALLAAASVNAQADLVLAGVTRPTNAVTTRTDGTVYFAVFDSDNPNANDPWGATLGAFNLINAALPGISNTSTPHPDQNSNGVSNPLDTNAKYLYVYMTYNSENNPGTNVSSISSNTVQVDPTLVTSWGAFVHAQGVAQDPTVQATGRSFLYFDQTSCPPGTGSFPANGNPSGYILCGTDGADPGNVVIGASPVGGAGGTANGMPTHTNLHTQTWTTPLDQYPQDTSTVALDDSGLTAIYQAAPGGPGFLLGNSGGVDQLQFSTVFYFTSNTPPDFDGTGIISGSTVAEGTVAVPKIPEPEMLAMLGTGLLLLGWSRRTRKS